MRSIYDIRKRLSDIPGIFFDLPPDVTERGKEYGLETLWNAESQNACSNHINELLSPGPEDDSSPPFPIVEIAAPIDIEKCREALGGGFGENIRKAIEIHGVDALAWYITFHARGAQPGIYIPVTSVLYFALVIFEKLQCPIDIKYQLAFRALHQHELFHFAADYMSAQWEAITSRPCFVPSRALKDSLLKYNILEEQLANANMLRAITWTPRQMKISGKARSLGSFVRSQPAGYKDAKDVFSSRAFVNACETLSRRYLSTITDYKFQYLDVVDLEKLYPFAPHIDWRYCPLHIVQDGARLNLPPLQVSLFSNITGIIPEGDFSRKLSELPARIQALWARAQDKLRINPGIRGLDFKKWDVAGAATVYSIRLDRAYRVHLRHFPEKKLWCAVDIGDHKRMGHG